MQTCFGAPVKEHTYSTSGPGPIGRMLQGAVVDPFGHMRIIEKILVYRARGARNNAKAAVSVIYARAVLADGVLFRCARGRLAWCAWCADKADIKSGLFS